MARIDFGVSRNADLPRSVKALCNDVLITAKLELHRAA
jgi:hypothetical protein